jgi:hypothetical protein
MELAIPLVALGGMYVISNQSTQHSSTKHNEYKVRQKETFNNMGKSTPHTQLPNTNIPTQNYPITNNAQLIDNIQEYPNPNDATDKYFNQNAYEQKQRSGAPVGNEPAQFYSLTGDYMSTQMFTHNNMVPFNGKKPHGQSYNNNNAETILDNYVGGGSQMIKKVEQAPLFKPQDNVQWTYGAPSMSDFYQSRQNPANKNNMVKPFESIQVGPGLDKGYTADGSLGFNSGMDSRDKWMPKNVDELRVVTNPKQEYDLVGLQGPAQSMIKNVGIEGKIEKNRPDTFFINTQDRWLTTTGAEKAPQSVPQFIVKPSTRNETSAHHQGAASAAIKTAGYAPTYHEETKRMQLEGFDVGASVATRSAPLQHEHADKCHSSHTNYENNRSINSQPQTFGSGFSRAMGAVIAPIMDILKPSRKEEYTHNMRVYGNIVGEVPGNYVSSGNVPNTTIKETTLYQPTGYINNQRDNAGYLATDHQPIANQRDTMNHDQLMGMSSKYGNRQYDANYRQTNNESKEKSVVGRINPGNAKQFNSYVNVGMSKLDSDRNNNRLWAPQAIIPSGPSMQTYGKIANVPQYTDNTITLDRINPDILDSIKNNPYVFSYNSVA